MLLRLVLVFFLFAKVPVAIIDKRRINDGEAEVFAVIGTIKGRHCILVDDMIDGGGTIRSAERCLMNRGAASVATYATHLILSGKAVTHFRSVRSQVVGTQTIPRSKQFRDHNRKWLTFVPIEPLLAKAIHEASIVGGSISKFSV